MNGTIKLSVFLLLVAALILPMVLKGPDGQPIMSLSDWLPDKSMSAAIDLSNSLKQEILRHAEVDTGSTDISFPPVSTSKNTLYKWKDERGQWHFSNEKPSTATRASVEQLPEIKNVMEAPVNREANSSTISLPGGFKLGN